jgi:hypothetical protein
MTRGAGNWRSGFGRTGLVIPRASGVPHASKIFMTANMCGYTTSGYRLLAVVDHPKAPDSCRP